MNVNELVKKLVKKFDEILMNVLQLVEIIQKQKNVLWCVFRFVSLII